MRLNTDPLGTALLGGQREGYNGIEDAGPGRSVRHDRIRGIAVRILVSDSNRNPIVIHIKACIFRQFAARRTRTSEWFVNLRVSWGRINARGDQDGTWRIMVVLRVL